MGKTLTEDDTLGHLAVTRAGASRLFHRLGLDFCCHGDVSVREACEARGIDAANLLEQIAEFEARSAGTFERWHDASLDRLIDHILERYHEPHRAELARLLAMARKVESVHAEKASVPRGLADFLEYLEGELEAHMRKEEEVLFPLIRSGNVAPAVMAIDAITAEHVEHGHNLERLRDYTDGYVPPADACNTWRALYLGLAELETELMEHISLENNVLFPRTLEAAGT